jgi:uncharacterized protein (DUF1684 family)
MTRRGAAVAIAGMAALCACRGSGGTMAPVPPPRSWAEELLEHRRARDAAFARDPDSPIPRAARGTFRGLAYFPPDPAFRYAGWVERYPTPERITIVTTSGTPRPCERWGRITFDRDGSGLTLQVYRMLDQPDRPGGEGLFLPFKDRTTGKETYPAGRYVDLEGPDGGPFVLDFNRAYNPSCAYGEPERFQCPVTPAENTLPIAVTAGERGPAHAVDEPAP